jgi:ribose/xylose/arabinose/galactoside ABC-type transport system permease subunit
VSRTKRPALGRLVHAPEVAPLTFLLLLGVLLTATTPGFAAIGNLTAIAIQVAVVGIVSLAVNQVILSGEIDVSTGSVLAVCCFVYGNVAQGQGGGLWLPLLATSIVGGIIGLINGALVTVARVPSIIATLGMQLLLRGVVLLWAANGVLRIPVDSRSFGLGTLLNVPIALLILALTYCLFSTLSRQTHWGRDVITIGSNPRAARVVGLRVDRVRLWCFVASGLACGLASAVLFGQIGQMQATVASGFELQVIAAVVLGGTRITGGRGSAAAPLIGAVLVGVILSALTLNRFPVTFEQFALGALILAAVAIDALRLRWIRAA